MHPKKRHIYLKIEKILQTSQQRSKAIYETVQPKLNEEVRKTREQIHEVLSPEQRKKYDEINKQPPSRKKSRPEQTGQRSNQPVPVPAPQAAPPDAAK